LPEITGVRRRGNRARVFVDGEFWAEVDVAAAAELGLYEGAELSDKELEEARSRGERALAMNRALNLIGYRARSEAEVRERLRLRGHGEGAIGAVIERLRELGYLDDEEFARSAAHQKARKYGPRRVEADLRRGGVGTEAARRAVEEEFDGRSELEDARRAARQRYNTEKSDALARRVYGFLMRRGYSADICAEVARGYRAGSGTAE
jgi:regulatory protein